MPSGRSGTCGTDTWTGRSWCPTTGSDDIEKALLSARLPSVFVGRPWYLPDRLSYVDTDNRLGAELATRHLLDRGRRRIGTVAGPAGHDRRRRPAGGWRTR